MTAENSSVGMKNYICNLKEWLREKGKKCVVVWGAGRGGEECAVRLSEYGIDFLFFVDSDGKKEFSRLQNKPVFAPRILDAFNKNDVFVFAASSKYYREIANILWEKGFVESYDFLRLPKNDGGCYLSDS